MEFYKLNLDFSLQKGITDIGYTELTDVQEQTLSKTLQGKDVAVQSQTGTGKTAAFLITIMERLSKKTSPDHKFALIIVPTRELAVQIEKEALPLCRHMKCKVGSFYGGVGYTRQLESLRKGVDIVIGTPGRLLDFSQKGYLQLKNVEILVIDEADRMFDMGFLPDITKLIQKMPSQKHRQSMLYSATLNRFSRTVAYKHMNNPDFIELTPDQMTVDTISQELYHVKSHIKLNLLLGILKAETPQNALIFTNTRHVAFRLSQKLKGNGYRCQHLTGDLPQNRRLKVIDDFMKGKFSLLVATDVAARGLHIDNLDMVFNYDIPQDCENYVHRIGRTARAGKKGKAVTLAIEGTASHLKAIEKFIGMSIPVQPENFDLIANDRSYLDPHRKRPSDFNRFRNEKRPYSRGRK
ncbi:MAG: DEAD/DEAH box helicase, partial [Candidatus Aminicenantaceae bacterium]